MVEIIEEKVTSYKVPIEDVQGMLETTSPLLDIKIELNKEGTKAVSVVFITIEPLKKNESSKDGGSSKK